MSTPPTKARRVWFRLAPLLSFTLDRCFSGLLPRRPLLHHLTSCCTVVRGDRRGYIASCHLRSLAVTLNLFLSFSFWLILGLYAGRDQGRHRGHILSLLRRIRVLDCGCWVWGLQLLSLPGAGEGVSFWDGFLTQRESCFHCCCIQCLHRVIDLGRGRERHRYYYAFSKELICAENWEVLGRLSDFILVLPTKIKRK